MVRELSERLAKFTFFFILILCVLSFYKTQVIYSATTHLVISEVQIAGSGGVNEDFIEIHNPTSSSIDLNGHRLVKRTASGTTDSSIKSWSTETIIPAGGYYLWANSSWSPSVTPDTTTASTLAADNGIAIRQGPSFAIHSLQGKINRRLSKIADRGFHSHHDEDLIICRYADKKNST